MTARYTVFYPAFFAFVFVFSLSSCSKSGTEVNSVDTVKSPTVHTAGSPNPARLAHNGGVVGSDSIATDIVWLDSAHNRRSMLELSKGKILLVCFGGLWETRFSPLVFNAVDSLRDIYDSSLTTLCVTCLDKISDDEIRNAIVLNGWKSQFVIDSQAVTPKNYLLGNSFGLPTEVIINQQGRVKSLVLGWKGIDAMRKLIDAIR